MHHEYERLWAIRWLFSLRSYWSEIQAPAGRWRLPRAEGVPRRSIVSKICLEVTSRATVQSFRRTLVRIKSISRDHGDTQQRITLHSRDSGMQSVHCSAAASTSVIISQHRPIRILNAPGKTYLQRLSSIKFRSADGAVHDMIGNGEAVILQESYWS